MATSSSISSGGLVQSLRTILKDTNFSYRQFDLSVSGGTTAVVSVIEDALVVTGSGGVTPTTFTFSQYPTIQDLVDALNAVSGFHATIVGDGDPNHDTHDLPLMPPLNVLNTTVVFSTRRWSDDEVQSMLARAVNRHNMSIPVDPTLQFKGGYSITTLPSEHEYFVLLLAQIESLKTQIQEGTKRKSTDLTVADFVALKNALEKEYADALKLFMSRRTTLTAADVKDIGSGDVIEGTTYRQSLHTSRRWPYGPRVVPSSAAPMPQPVHLAAQAIAAGQVQLRWDYNRDTAFNRYEVWRGNTRDVSDLSAIVRPFQTIAATGTRIVTRYQRSQNIWIDGAATPLPAGTYYYVVYVFNMNDEGTPSNVAVVPVA